MKGYTESLFQSLPETLCKAGADAIVLDQYQPYVELIHYSGPWHDGYGRIPVEFPWERLTGEPIVYVSMDTLQNGVTETFRAIVASARTLKNLQFVLVIGNQITSEQIGETASNVLTVAYALHTALLKPSSLCVTHAGLNTALEALAFGVPLLAIPITNDQPGVAARIAHKEVGLVISQDKLSSSDLAALIKQAVEDSTLRVNARRLSESISKTDGLAVAAGLIEEAFGLRAAHSPSARPHIEPKHRSSGDVYRRETRIQ